MARLLFLRHAQTIWNAEGRWQGHADPPLSDLGTAQCAQAAALLRDEDFDLVVTSDLLRARQTGELIAGAWDRPVETTLEPLLRERDIGDWSAMTTTEIREGWPAEYAAFTSDESNAPPSGEPLERFDERACEALHRVQALATGGAGSQALVVTHGGIIRSLIRQAGLERRPVGNLSGGWVEIDGGDFRVQPWVDLLSSSLSSGADATAGPTAALLGRPAGVTAGTDPESQTSWL